MRSSRIPKFRLWHLHALVVVLAVGLWLPQILIEALFGYGRSVELAFSSKFQAAQQAFDAAASTEEFLRAAALYQEILDSGVVSGVVLYNQGNAFMRGGHRGRAVACYLQAQRYRPRDPYLEANLQNALGEVGVRARNRPVVEYLLFWQDWISYPGKFTLTTLAALVTFVLAATSLFWRRRLLKYMAVAVLGLTLAIGVSAVYDWYRFSYIQHGVVIRADLVARKGNADSYEPAFNKPLAETTHFVVIDRRGDWLLIRLPGSQEGWIPLHDAVVF